MYQSLQITIPTSTKYLNAATAIYAEQPFQLQSFESFLDFTHTYEAAVFKKKSQIFYVLFTGKQIKQRLNTKRTLITARKIPAEELLSAISIDTSFNVQKNYEIIPVNDIFLCDLLYAIGGIFEANEIHAAVFLPYFLENPSHADKVSLIFANVVFERFKLVSRSIFHHLSFSFYTDGKPFNIDQIQKEDFCRWLCLHEYMHNSGPLSLFRSTASKFSAKHYGFIEELRVDLTTIKILLKNFDHTANYANNRLNIIAIIILERIFRGSLYNYRKNWHCPRTGMLAKEVEGDVSICWLALLHQHGFLNLKERVLDIDYEKLNNLVHQILCDIYHYEQIASDKNAFNNTSHNFAAWFRKKYISLNDSVLDFLNHFSVQNCEYAIKFIPL